MDLLIQKVSALLVFLLLDLDKDIPALDGDAGDLLLDLDEDLPAFGDDLLFSSFSWCQMISPFLS